MRRLKQVWRRDGWHFRLIYDLNSRHLMYNPHPYPLSTYPASRGSSLACNWLLAFKKSFVWLVWHVVVALRGVNKPTTQQTSHANDFVNAKSNVREKPLLAGYSVHHQGLTSTPDNFNVLLYLTFIIITLLKANCFKRVLNPNHCPSVRMLNPVFNSFPCTTVSYSDFPLFSKMCPIHPHKWFSRRSI